jgi:hypothetical protein
MPSPQALKAYSRIQMSIQKDECRIGNKISKLFRLRKEYKCSEEDRNSGRRKQLDSVS